MGPFSLMVARFPGQNQEHPDSAGYVMNLMETLHNDDRIGEIHPFRLSDTPITMSRNRCVKTALDLGIDYLLMIDADMSPDCEPGARPFWETAWEFMMDRRASGIDSATEIEYEAEAALAMMDKGIWLTSGGYTWRNTPDNRYNGRAWGEYCAYGDFPGCIRSSDAHTIEDIRMHGRWRLSPHNNPMLPGLPPATIAAPYCGPPPHECVYVFRWASKSSGDAEPSFRLEMFDRDDAARKTGIEEVAALPTGLILYDMRVFKTLPPPWFKYEWTDQYETHKASTEDVYQTRNASLMGLPQFCTWDCWAGHIKTKTVTKPVPMTVGAMRTEMRNALLRMPR